MLRIKPRGGLAILLSLLMFNCVFVQAAEPRLRIVTTIKPVQLLVTAIVGDDHVVDVLLDPGMSPHDYQLRPSDRRKLDAADVVFWVGPELEIFMVPVLSSLDRGKPVVALQDAVGEGDPHIWMDPVLAGTLGRRIADALEKLAPTSGARWRDNATQLEKSLVQEDARLRTQIASIDRPRGYLVAHDAYGRFEARYGIRHGAALTDASDLPPSAQHLVQIENALRTGEISCALREPSHPSKLFQNLLKGRNVKVETVDAMGANIAPGTKAMNEFYREMGASIARCLQP